MNFARNPMVRDRDLLDRQDRPDSFRRSHFLRPGSVWRCEDEDSGKERRDNRSSVSAFLL